MANSGIKIVLTLKEINDSTGLPTGNTKPNVSNDPDYIPPSTDLTACPVTYTTDCPVVIATGVGGNTIEYEFNLNNSVINNPIVKKVVVNLKSGVTVIQSDTFTLPIPTINYFSGDFTGLSSGTYSIETQYLDASDVVNTTCPNLAIINL